MSEPFDITVVPHCYYFGCHRGPGHYLWTERQQMAPRQCEGLFPFRYTILDAGLLPQHREQIEGYSTITHFLGWTVVSFWDRSIDKRGGCNSSFVIPGHWTFSEAIEISKARFPWVWERIKFDVSLGGST